MARALVMGVASVLLIWTVEAAQPAWDVQVVDQSGTANYTALRVDREGNAHVAYVAEQNDHHVLRYAFWDHALKRWFTMTVANGASFCSLALDSKQRPHISWADYGTGEGARLRYAQWEGTSWKITAIPLNSEVIAYYTSVVLDRDDYPSISFYEYRGPRGTETSVRMRVVTWNGQYWQVKTIDHENQSGKFNSMAIDSQSRMHLAYANVGAQTAGIRYAMWDGETWNAEVIEDLTTSNGEHVGYSAFIALDRSGAPHIVYSNSSHPSVRYAYRSGKKWMIQTVDTVSGVAYPDRYSIALTDQGAPYISYCDPGLGAVKVASRRGSKWSVEVVDEGGVGFTSAVDIHKRQLWVSYADMTNGALKVARRDLDGPDERAETSQNIEPTVDRAGTPSPARSERLTR